MDTKKPVKKEIQAIVSDIEGTTTASTFVTDVLIPYAKKHLNDFFQANKDKPVIEQLCEDVKIDAKLPHINPELALSILKIWMDQNQNFNSLKKIQGLIFEQGFKSGDFKGHVFEDACEGFKKWKTLGIPLYLFAYDSMHSQKLLFQHSMHGNLTPLVKGYFDTNIGCKKLALSYRKISNELGCDPSKVLFLSDCLEELDAAKLAGMQTTLVRRSALHPPICPHPVVKNFDEIKC